MTRLFVTLLALLIAAPVLAQTAESPAPAKAPPLQINGVFPKLTVYAPEDGSDSETGIGALIPWADKLWAVGYVAHIKGNGIGLYEISDDMTMRKHPESVTGTFANRLIHWETRQAIIGPHVIDPKGNVRTFPRTEKASPDRDGAAPAKAREHGLFPDDGRQAFRSRLADVGSDAVV